MTDRPARPGGPPIITVLVLADDFSGALAYALDYALFRPAAVRAVRVPGAALMHPPAPIPIRDIGGNAGASLMRLSTSSERMVAQIGGRDPRGVLAQLRQSTHSPLVEVDRDGAVVRFTDPWHWSRSLRGSAAG
ncbi:hypothetical protein [Aeromicrobium wangtongii]|uniref:hypothetical protein n=1 Tax=Aeromicrobium wangtongii TaxID=2969247 RepID=UPI002016AE86|nr:hypothetical protein [Aeromicrobium wangtongii]MCL3819282.1 hypothetical protein [Aeromicrobium wangtongii]